MKDFQLPKLAMMETLLLSMEIHERFTTETVGKAEMNEFSLIPNKANDQISNSISIIVSCTVHCNVSAMLSIYYVHEGKLIRQNIMKL